MNGEVKVKKAGDSNKYIAESSDWSLSSTNPTSSKYNRGITFLDSKKNETAIFRTIQTTNGMWCFELLTRLPDLSGWKAVLIGQPSTHDSNMIDLQGGFITGLTSLIFTNGSRLWIG